jgi:drug/metabolite transporter (DMT)-like permease
MSLASFVSLLSVKPNRLLTWAALAALILIWGTTWSVIRIGLRGIPPFAGVALRFALASAVLLALAPVFGVKLGRQPNERRVWWVNTFLTFTIPYGIVYWSEQWLPSGLTAVIFATMPLLTALAAHFALPAERLTARTVAGIVVGFAGIAVIFSEDFRTLGGSQVAKAAAVLLIAPFCAALANVAVKRWGGGIHPISISAVPMGITALIMGSLAWLVEPVRTASFNTLTVLSFVYLALIGSAVPFTLYFWLLRSQSATGLSTINYATPIIAVAVGTLFLGEPFTARIVAGSALVLVGVALTVRKGSGRPEIPPAKGAISDGISSRSR